jgi:hypothetical protein
MVDAAEKHGMQVIWTLCHYGWPDDIDVFAPEFVERFAKFCGETAKFIASRSRQIPFYTPSMRFHFWLNRQDKTEIFIHMPMEGAQNLNINW